MKPKILALAGSNRQDSWNWKLVRFAAQYAEAAGVRVTLPSPEDLELPLVNEDLVAQEGYPEKARWWKRLFVEHHGLLIASPEYNGFFTPALKNLLDWLSIKETPEEPSLVAFRGKVAALLATSPGSQGACAACSCSGSSWNTSRSSYSPIRPASPTHPGPLTNTGT